MGFLARLAAILCLAATGLQVHAAGTTSHVSVAEVQVTATDLQVAARALSFMEKPLKGRVRVGIVYAPEIPSSVRQAQELREMLGNGLKVASLELRPVLVERDRAATADVELFFFTAGTRLDTPLSAIIAARQIPCITTDIAQVENGDCTIGVRSKPKVEILVNRAAAKASGMTFATAFRVMITEI